MAQGVKRIEKEKDILKLTIEKSKAHLEELEEKLELMKVNLGRMLEVGWWKRAVWVCQEHRKNHLDQAHANSTIIPRTCV